jgi:N utilization substance protein A
MDGDAMRRIVDTMHREKNISKDLIFSAIEQALVLAIQKHFPEDEQAVTVTIDRETGVLTAVRGEEVIDPTLLGRIAATSAKQFMIQKIREGESEVVFEEFEAQKGNLVHGVVQRFEGGAAIVSLGKTEAILPRGEQIPGESHHAGERVKAIILEVRKSGHRVKIILSRTHPDFVRRLFETEIPEIEEKTIEIRAVAREAGYRTKIAVSSVDLKVDCVGACVGVRGSRIKNIVDELGGERIDIVRWNDSLQVLIPNALSPASIEEVFLYPRLGRAIVLVKEDQLSLAIGRRGQNVRLASKLVGWDIEIMTHEELNESIERAVGWFSEIPNIGEPQVEVFIEEGFLSYDDLTFMGPPEFAELAGVTEEQAEQIIQYAEEASERVEQEAKTTKATRMIEQGEVQSSPAPARTGDEKMDQLFPTLAAEPVGEENDRPTAESLLGPAGTAPEESPAPPEPPPADEAPPLESSSPNGQE